MQIISIAISAITTFMMMIFFFLWEHERKLNKELNGDFKFQSFLVAEMVKALSDEKDTDSEKVRWALDAYWTIPF